MVTANEPISRDQWSAYEQALARRLEREPVAYITGTREFWSLDFYVTPAVLIPRPETELVVEGRVDRVDGRKLFCSAELRDADGTLLADCEALMVQLRPGQP